MNHAPPFLLQLVVMVAASAAAAYLCARLRILPIVGFLLRPARRTSDAEAEARIAALTATQREACRHAATVQREMTSATTVCEECVKSGDPWVHLRICMTCGSVGCCNSSKNRHATRQFETSGHPVIRSWQPGEDWAWCYVDEQML